MKETNVYENSNIYLVGEITGIPEISHEIYGEKFYVFPLSSKRLSGTTDVLDVLISECLLPEDFSSLVGQVVEINGEIRSYNRHNEDTGKTNLILSIFVRTMNTVDSSTNHDNRVDIVGYITKPPVFRKTPLGREICDLLIAVNRPYGKSDYIPVLTWGRTASRCASFDVGTKVSIFGRFQSREYQKIINNETVTKKAFELSASRCVREIGDI